MKFRMIWMGSDDDPDQQRPLLKHRATISDPVYRTSYEERDGAMLRRDVSKDGRLKFTPLTDFIARIVGDVILDDGDQERREFEIEAHVGGLKTVFRMPVTEFSRMNWVLRRLGSRAIVYPGQQQHARAAIQWISGQIRQERILTHLGWTKQGEQWIYLHAGGALGADDACSGVRVQLCPALQLYRLPWLEDPAEGAKSIRMSLRCLSLAPDRISIPLLAAVYRAPFGGADFSLFLAGRTGGFKTALAAIAQQHFGAGLNAAHLPGHFASTANALESLAFEAKDALLVVDDFAPTGRYSDERMEGIAERLFRAAGNHQGRGRMAGNGRMRPSLPPRALVLATGEEVPQDHSIRARLLIVEVVPGDVDRNTLSECQGAGEDGRLAASMSAYLGWIAGRYEQLQQRLKTRTQEIRDKGTGRTVHARLPAALAELQGGFEIWLEFALEQGVMTATEHEEWEQRTERAFEELAVLQARYHQASDPALRFVGLLQAALASGHAHLANRRGTVPESPGSWGWRRRQAGQEWIPQGTRIGWVTGSDVFLEPTASYQVAQALAGPERLPVSQQTLHHRLREGGLLASLDPARQMVQIRRTLESCPRQVLHLKAELLTGNVPGAGKWPSS